jgi:hypothetical protein
MAVMHNLRALGLFVGIEAEDDGDGLACGATNKVGVERQTG